MPPLLQYSDHQVGRGPEFYARPCELSLEGIVSEQADAPYAPGNRGLLAYYTPDGRLVYAGRAGGGINNAEFERLCHLLQPLAAPDMPLDVLPPRNSRFSSPLVLSRVHWV